jgi:hypothetical protein
MLLLNPNFKIQGPESPLRFQIEYITDDKRRPYLFARQLDEGDFALTEASTLGGVRLKPVLTQPRALTPEGKPDRDLFTFCPASAADLKTLHVGQIVFFLQ